jgi:cytochrome c-type biogenesis protein CcmH/NrfF
MHLLASSFFAGAILSWALPVALTAVVGLYWIFLLRRRSPGARTGKVE